jgi:hypothetical protein
MNKEEEIKIIENMQQVVEQIKKDDLEENPDCENDFFDCDCCGQYKSLAGSIQYNNYRLCNDCVLIAETGFALKKISNIEDLMSAMEDKRLEEICNFINQDKNRINN